MTWENLVGDSSSQQVLLPNRQRPQSKLIPVNSFPDHPGGHKRGYCGCKNKHLLHSHFYLDVKGVESPVLWPYNQELKGQARFLRQQEYWPWCFVSNYLALPFHPQRSLATCHHLDGEHCGSERMCVCSLKWVRLALFYCCCRSVSY